MSTGSLRRKIIAGAGVLMLGVNFLGAALPAQAQIHVGEDGATTAASASTAGDTGASDVSATTTLTSGEGICGTTFAGYMCQAITVVLSFTADLIGTIVLTLIDIMIAFAKYNDFQNANIVTMGWRVVRDVVNMFYIVILLISAFATIIGTPEEFHYKKVLPKLLLSAVLINFSRTLIQLLVDFSQVIMLTFVNAFSQAAAGNFVSALRLNDILNIAQSTPASDGTGGFISSQNIITAYMLANFLLAIMLGTIAIMTGFLIVRIVVIWLSLVLSPIAFFATALPSTARKALGAFTSDYWDRLTNALIGGPVMAFFLWLTLAVVQASAGSAGGLAPALSFHTSNGFELAISSIGNTQDIASFVIGITLMLAGLSFSVSMAGKLGSSALKEFAGQASNRAQQAGRFFATLPYTAAGRVASGVGSGVRAGAREADRRLQLTQRAATGIAQTRVGQVAGRLPFVGGTVREGLRRGMSAYEGETNKARQSITGFSKETLAALPPDKTRDDYVKQVLSSNPSSPEDKKSYQDFAEYVRSDDYRNSYQRRNEANYVKELQGKGMTEDEAKNGSKVLVQQDIMNQEREAFQKDLQYAKDRRDFQRQANLEKEMKTKPYLAPDDKRGELTKDLATDADKYKEITPFDASSGNLLTEMMINNGYTVDDKTKELKLTDAAAYDRLKTSVKKSGNKNLTGMLEAHEEFVRNSPGLTDEKARSLQHRFNAGDGTYQTFDVTKTGNEWSGDAGKRVRNTNQQKAYNSLSEASKARGAGEHIDEATAMQFINNGGRLPELMKITGNSDKDPQPIQDIAADIGGQIGTAVASFANNQKESGVTAFQGVSKIITQLDDKGITEPVQIEIVSKFGGGRGETLLNNYGSLSDQGKRAIVKAAEVALNRADDIRQRGGPSGDTANKAKQQAVLDFADIVIKRSTQRDSNLPQALRQIARDRGVETPQSS